MLISYKSQKQDVGCWNAHLSFKEVGHAMYGWDKLQRDI